MPGIAGMAVNGCKWLKRDRNNQNGWKWLEMAGNGWIKIQWDGLTTVLTVSCIHQTSLKTNLRMQRLSLFSPYKSKHMQQSYLYAVCNGMGWSARTGANY